MLALLLLRFGIFPVLLAIPKLGKHRLFGLSIEGADKIDGCCELLLFIIFDELSNNISLKLAVNCVLCWLLLWTISGIFNAGGRGLDTLGFVGVDTSNIFSSETILYVLHI